ncbi:MAG: Rdx family protein [Burkholderiales bacterium]|nr:Rdx family protein [Burkholderiales bacterium]
MLLELGPADVELLPGRAGQFDIEVDGALRYSRAQTRGFPTEAELAGLVPELGG